MNIDLNQLASALIAGGAIWAGIRLEIKFLWRDMGRLENRVEKIEGGK